MDPLIQHGNELIAFVDAIVLLDFDELALARQALHDVAGPGAADSRGRRLCWLRRHEPRGRRRRRAGQQALLRHRRRTADNHPRTPPRLSGADHDGELTPRTPAAGHRWRAAARQDVVPALDVGGAPSTQVPLGAAVGNEDRARRLRPADSLTRTRRTGRRLAPRTGVKDRKAHFMTLDAYPSTDYAFEIRQPPVSGNHINGLNETDTCSARRSSTPGSSVTRWGSSVPLPRHPHERRVDRAAQASVEHSPLHRREGQRAGAGHGPRGNDRLDQGAHPRAGGHGRHRPADRRHADRDAAPTIRT